MSGAVSALARSADLADHDAILKNNVIALRDRAIKLGGTILPPPPAKVASGPVTREEFETALVILRALFRPSSA